jgi:DNA-binding Lrp family transcriptional regulator
MLQRLDHIDQRLLDEFQRDLPLVAQPFASIAEVLGVSEDRVIDRLKALGAAGAITRVGATVHPNTVGASTLAAMAVPEKRIDEVAEIVNDERGVNHSYLREDDWNLWFVATAPDVASLEVMLKRIEARTGLEVLDLRLVRPFNIDLGFRLSGARATLQHRKAPDVEVLRDGDSQIVQEMTEGLPLVPRPFASIAGRLGRSEADIIARLAALQAAGILSRIGIIVRHRAIGWTANAMVVWDLPEDRIEAAGLALARHPGVTLCYQRRTVPGVWPYGLFNMIHARSRAEALDVLEGTRVLPELEGATCRVLFSTHCFRQSGALVHQEAAA